jgi:hypothetical protein
VLETAVKNEAELTEYFPQHGLYSERIKACLRACEQANNWEEAHVRHTKEEIRSIKQKQKEHERQTWHEAMALQEAAASLVLNIKCPLSLGKARAHDID